MAEIIPNALGVTRLDDLYSTATGRLPPVTSSHALAEKLTRNADRADLLYLVDPSAAARLRACRRRPRSNCRVSRICVFCSQDRVSRLVSRYRDRLLRIHCPYHLTLTSYPHPYLNRAALRELKDRFRRLRGGRRFGRLVLGGLANIEVEWGRAGWLPHVHAVLSCTAEPPLSFFKQEWMRLGGGRQVHLQGIRKGDTPNVFAYSAQAPNLPTSGELVGQLYRAGRGFPFVSAWGTIHHAYGRRVCLRIGEVAS